MISYKPLFKTIEEKNTNLFAIEKALGLSPTVTAKFRKNERVSLETIERICNHLDVPIECVVEVIRQKIK